MATFAEQLTAARKAAGMTQEELSAAVHVARNTISNWEHGRTEPDLDTLRLLEQILHVGFLNVETNAQGNSDKTDDTPVLSADAEANEQTASGESKAIPQKRKKIILAAVLAAIVLCAGIILAVTLLKKPADSVPAANGTRYAIADYDQTTPNEAGKAYLTIVKTLSVRPGDGKDYYAINFTAREDNGIAFTIDRLEMVIFFTDHADVYVFSHDDLANVGYEPDMPAYGFISIDNGFPTDQKGLQGMSIKIMGTDANSASLTFTSYLPIP